MKFKDSKALACSIGLLDCQHMYAKAEAEAKAPAGAAGALRC
ncbi:hypothetical protein [Paraburkholderia flagellata]|nr:hypothetical protein [Paraburkholderia flagellata]